MWQDIHYPPPSIRYLLEGIDYVDFKVSVHNELKLGNKIDGI